MGVAKWIKGKNGKFLGSIGIGKNTLPAEMPQAPVGFGNIPGVPSLPGANLGQSYEQYLATRPSDAEYFENALHALENTTDMYGGTVAEKINFKASAAKYAESDEGQIAVLEKADEYLRAGNITRARELVDAAAEGRKAQDAAAAAKGGNVQTANNVIAMYDQNAYDRVETAIAEFRTAAMTPYTIPAIMDRPEQRLPFNPIAAGEALGRVAGIIDAARYENTDYSLPVQKKDVYSEHLVDAAHKLSGIRYAQSHPGQEQYVHGDYFTFIDKVEQAHGSNHSILRHKIDRQLSAARHVKNMKDPNFGRNLFG